MALTSRLIMSLASGLVCVCLCGCPSGNEIGGIWRPLETDGKLIFDSETGEATVGFELVMEHYGPDVAGLIRFYGPDKKDGTVQYDFLREPTTKTPAAKAGECGCIYMYDGRYGETSKSYRFATHGCVPGIAGDSSVELRGDLQLNDAGQLVGTLKVADTVDPEKIETMVLEREAAAGSILPSEFTCERVLDADAGNIHSGN